MMVFPVKNYTTMLSKEWKKLYPNCEYLQTPSKYINSQFEPRCLGWTKHLIQNEHKDVFKADVFEDDIIPNGWISTMFCFRIRKDRDKSYVLCHFFDSKSVQRRLLKKKEKDSRSIFFMNSDLEILFHNQQFLRRPIPMIDLENKEDNEERRSLVRKLDELKGNRTLRMNYTAKQKLRLLQISDIFVLLPSFRESTKITEILSIYRMGELLTEEKLMDAYRPGIMKRKIFIGALVVFLVIITFSLGPCLYYIVTQESKQIFEELDRGITAFNLNSLSIEGVRKNSSGEVSILITSFYAISKLLNEANTCFMNNELDNALELYERLYRVAKAVDNLNLMGIVKNNIANIYQLQGKPRQAIPHYIEAYGLSLYQKEELWLRMERDKNTNQKIEVLTKDFELWRKFSSITANRSFQLARTLLQKEIVNIRKSSAGVVSLRESLTNNLRPSTRRFTSYAEVIKYLQTCFKIETELMENIGRRVYVAAEISICFAKLANIPEAERYLKIAQNLYHENDPSSFGLIFNREIARAKIFLALSIINKVKGNYKRSAELLVLVLESGGASLPSDKETAKKRLRKLFKKLNINAQYAVESYLRPPSDVPTRFFIVFECSEMVASKKDQYEKMRVEFIESAMKDTDDLTCIVAEDDPRVYHIQYKKADLGSISYASLYTSEMFFWNKSPVKKSYLLSGIEKAIGLYENQGKYLEESNYRQLHIVIISEDIPDQFNENDLKRVNKKLESFKGKILVLSLKKDVSSKQKSEKASQQLFMCTIVSSRFGLEKYVSQNFETCYGPLLIVEDLPTGQLSLKEEIHAKSNRLF
eukprot:TRINITY_DN13564_c0_g1_i2.p1 TRINITY_DN13564_c0_g1~~TRINITY_DN13564_c0_g1_i2.p1  ORF type:complete len:816 (-),score=131.29 TRINITY_DN13564_c0_g1_i2:147-2594(-)